MQAARVPAVICAAWLALHAPTLAWVVRGWLRPEGQAQGLVAVALLVLLIRERPSPGRPHLHLGALLTVLGAAAGRWATAGLGLESADAVWAVVGTAGLAGMFTPRAPILGALGLALLPVLPHVDAYVGFPIRLVTAQLAADALGWLGSAPVAVGTVLRVEGAAAHVDVACAGLRSVWTLGLVVLAAALQARRSLAAAVLAGLAGAAVLLTGNLARVIAVVALHHVADQPLLAEVVHVPAGILAFVAGAAVSCGVLTLLSPRTDRGPGRPTSFGAALAVGVWALAIHSPTPSRPAPPPPASVALPAGFTPVAPAPSEARFAAERRASLARGTFDVGDLRGSVVLVRSRSSLAHHTPAWCLEATGWRLDDHAPHWVDGSPLRIARAVNAGRPATALWWFQSAEASTDDAATRAWSGLRTPRPWVLVSVLVEDHQHPDDPALHDLVRDLRQGVAHDLEDRT